MKSFVAPNGSIIFDSENTITTFGITPEDQAAVFDKLPSDKFVFITADCASDIIAIPSCAVILNAPAIKEHEMNTLSDFYREVGDTLAEHIFWIGSPLPSFSKNRQIKFFPTMDAFLAALPYAVLDAQHKQAKTKDFSRRLADCLQILSVIRSHPGITSKELSEKLELSLRTVQRNVATLQAAGEWIEYDRKKKGWFLQNGISVLFGDHLKK